MLSALRFAHPIAWCVALVALAVAVLLRLLWHKGVRYHYSLVSSLAARNVTSRHPFKKILFVMRLVTLLLLTFLVGKPQRVDITSSVPVEGIDIMLVLDVSGSMSMPHHTGDERSRFDVAKYEAIRFIDKRTHDAIGIVLFGNDAVSRSPLTADKLMLKQIVRDTEIGIVNPEGTLLATSIITAANRLKHSTAKSKVMILLTDGEPSENDIDAGKAIQVAKSLGIKIYTIGIGDDQEVIINHPFYGPFSMKTTLNKPLLMRIAQETGGKFFEAKNANDMGHIYDSIDKLEKTKLDRPLFTRYSDIFMPYLLTAWLLVIVEIFLRSFWWFSL